MSDDNSPNNLLGKCILFFSLIFAFLEKAYVHDAQLFPVAVRQV